MNHFDAVAAGEAIGLASMSKVDLPPLPGVDDEDADEEVVGVTDMELPLPPVLKPSLLSTNSTSKEGASSEVVFLLPDEGTPAAAALAANAELKLSKADKLMHKIRGMKRPKMKSLNVIKQLRKRTKMKRKKFKNFQGKVIDGEHELYVITAGIILGIRCSVKYWMNVPMAQQSMLTLEDFNYVEKASFPAKGGNGPLYPTPPHSLLRTFKFKSYSPKVFCRIRDLFNIDTSAYMDSVCGNYSFIEFMSNSKSGQFFFYTHDGKYMLKTQTKEENKFMKLILPHYYRYVAENPHTLLVRFLGMHRVKLYQFRRKVHFVVMTSVFDTPEEIHVMYDLKGSTHGRAATVKERANGGVLKDLDLLADNRKLHLGQKKGQFMAQLRRDATFLASLGIMDYSLLVGIHMRSRRQEIHVALKSQVVEDSISVVHSNTPLRRATAIRNAHGSTDLMGTDSADENEKDKLKRLSYRKSAMYNAMPENEIILQGPVDIITEGHEGEALVSMTSELNFISDDKDDDKDDDDKSIVDSELSFSSGDSLSDAGNSDIEEGGEEEEIEILQRDLTASSRKEAQDILSGTLYYTDEHGLEVPEGSRLSNILSSSRVSKKKRNASIFNMFDSAARLNIKTYNDTSSNQLRATDTKRRSMVLKGLMGGEPNSMDGATMGTSVSQDHHKVDQVQRTVKSISNTYSAQLTSPWTHRKDLGINSRTHCEHFRR